MTGVDVPKAEFKLHSKSFQAIDRCNDLFAVNGSFQGYICMSTLHPKHGFAKSKATLGTVGPVDRLRVGDLVNLAPDKPLTATARVPRPF